MKINENFSVLFWLFKSKKTKDGQVPIYVRLTVNGLRAEFSSGKKIDPINWNEETGYPSSKYKDGKAITSYINRTLSELEKHYNRLSSIEELVTVDMLKDSYLPKQLEHKTLLEAVNIFVSDFRELVVVNKKAKGTLRRYVRTENKIKAFIKIKYKASDIILDKIDYSFAERFFHYLLTKEQNENTAYQYVKTLKQIIRKSVNLGWIKFSQIAGYKCSYKQPKREYLTIEEIYAIYKKPIDIARLAQVRDVYLFCCFTGYSYETVFKLEPSNIFKGIDGQYWITKNRQKTGSEETVPLLPMALEILSKYKNDPYCLASNKLLPVNCNQKYNAYIKEVADLCQINKHLTTHTARHTFATTVTLENDVPIETVSNMLGHKDIRTTQIYAKVTKRKISNNMNDLRRKIFDSEGLFNI